MRTCSCLSSLLMPILVALASTRIQTVHGFVNTLPTKPVIDGSLKFQPYADPSHLTKQRPSLVLRAEAVLPIPDPEPHLKGPAPPGGPGRRGPGRGRGRGRAGDV